MHEPSPRAPTEYPSRFIRRAQAQRGWGALADLYGRSLGQGDALADDLAAWLEANPSGRPLFERALNEGLSALDDPPAPLRALFESVETRPAWLNDAQLALGAATCQRFGPSLMFVLSAWSLMNGYHSAPAVKPLSFTGQLDSMAPRRLAETGRFVVETCQTGGMTRFAPGFVLAVRVRVLHAMVRRMITKSGRWQTEDWGVPINQADMVGTIMEFSLLLLEGARTMGFTISAEEAEAVVHLWRYSGYLGGVDEALLEELSTEARGVRFAELVKLTQPGPDADSLSLAAALRLVPMQTAKSRVQKFFAPMIVRYHDGLTHVFNGPDIAGALHIPNPRWRHAVHASRAMVRVFEVVRRLRPDGDEWASRVGNKALRGEIDRLLGGSEPTFQPKRVARSSAQARA